MRRTPSFLEITYHASQSRNFLEALFDNTEFSPCRRWQMYSIGESLFMLCLDGNPTSHSLISVKIFPFFLEEQMPTPRLR